MSQPFQPAPITFVGNKFAYASPGQIIAAGAALPAVGILVVILRFYSRVSKRVKLGADDYLILPALLFVIAMGATIIAGVELKAVGYPTPPPPPPTPENPTAFLTNKDPKITIVQKVQFITQLFMVAAYGFVKLSAIFFYRRIFSMGKLDWFNYVTQGCAVIIGLWSVAYIFAIAFDCGTNWFAHWGSIADILNYCGKGRALQQIVSSLLYSDLITDVVILLLPVPKIWTLHLKPAKKWAVMGIFLLGGIATGASAARIYIFHASIIRSLDPTLDENQTVSTVVYWSMIEAGLAVIAACLPTAQNIFRGHSIGSVVASVRSAISLPSIARSQDSEGSAKRSRNQTTMQQNNDTGSFKRLEEERSFTTDHNSGQEVSANATADHFDGPGVNKTVSIEMVSQKGTQEPIVVHKNWERV